MCGYVRRHIGSQSLKEFMGLLGPTDYNPHPGEATGELQHFYPAFGRDPGRKIKDLVIQEGGMIKGVEATWWYDCTFKNGQLEVGNLTSFNARHLSLPLWREAIRYRRGFVVASGLGESREIGKRKHQYLVTSDRPLIIGAVYNAFPEGLYSCAIITRDPHPRFTEFHEDAFPLLLPNNMEFLKLWLSDTNEEHPDIARVLNAPKIYADLQVVEVKSFKSGVPVGPAQKVAAD